MDNEKAYFAQPEKAMTAIKITVSASMYAALIELQEEDDNGGVETITRAATRILCEALTSGIDGRYDVVPPPQKGGKRVGSGRPKGSKNK